MRRSLTISALAAFWLVVTPLARAQIGDEEQETTISDGNQVGIEYTLKLEDGTVAYSNVGGEPLVYTQGQGQILPALEKALLGLQVGDTKTVELESSEAYGPVDPDAYQSVPKEQVPEDARKPGAILGISRQDGRQRQVRVQEVREDQVVIDFNHPLAGKDLTFDVKVLSIK